MRVELPVQIVEALDNGIHGRLVERSAGYRHVDLVGLACIADVGRTVEPAPVRGHRIAGQRRLGFLVEGREQRVQHGPHRCPRPG